MRASTSLRIAVVSELFLVAGSLTLSETLTTTLPAELQAWLEQEAAASFTVSEAAALVGLLLALALWCVSFVGLLLLKKWAAWTYLAASVIGYLCSALSRKPVVEVAIADVVDELSILASGIVIGIAFFSDALVPSRKNQLPPLLPHGQVPNLPKSAAP